MTKIIVPVSGGKDSQATLHLAMQDGREVVPVYYETHWDHPTTYKHLDKMMNFYNLKLEKTIYKEAPSMVELILQKGFFPNGKARFCSERFKTRALKRWANSIDGKCEIWLGIRTDESWQRKKKYGKCEEHELYNMDDLFPKEFPKRIKSRMKYKLPILNRSEKEVFKIIKKSNFSHNPLYDLGFDRVGCFPCLCAGKKTHNLAYRTKFGKKQYTKIKYLEREIGQIFKFSENDLCCSVCKI